jgi:DNA-binding winged helix-turn-helix (wHTH) protein
MLQERKKFEFGPYVLDARGILLCDGVPVSLRPKQFCVLKALVDNAGDIVSYDDFLDTCWGEDKGGPENVTKAVSEIRSILTVGSGKYIETVSRRGYRFVAKVREVAWDSGSGDEHSTDASGQGGRSDAQDQAPSQTASTVVGGMSVTQHQRFLLICCLIYACHYVLTLLLEIAYKLNLYWKPVALVSPFLLCWILVTSVYGLRVAIGREDAGKGSGLAFGSSIFLGAAGIAMIAAWVVLPGVPITEAKFQTYSAPAAYLKDMEYIIPVALLFLLLPFHLISRLEREVGKGRSREVLRLLKGSRLGVVPRGAFFY